MSTVSNMFRLRDMALGHVPIFLAMSFLPCKSFLHAQSMDIVSSLRLLQTLTSRTTLSAEMPYKYDAGQIWLQMWALHHTAFGLAWQHIGNTMYINDIVRQGGTTVIHNLHCYPLPEKVLWKLFGLAFRLIWIFKQLLLVVIKITRCCVSGMKIRILRICTDACPVSWGCRKWMAILTTPGDLNDHHLGFIAFQISIMHLV